MPNEAVYPVDVSPFDCEPHYTKHVAAMTAEKLHHKSDIAVQLAWRDRQIDELRSELSTLGTSRVPVEPGVVTRGWTPMLDAHGQLNVPEGEFCIFHAKPKDNDAEGYFCDSLAWDDDAEALPQWQDGEHGWDIDDVCEFHVMPARGAAAKPPAGVEVGEALKAVAVLEAAFPKAAAWCERQITAVATIRSALEKCR